MMPKEDSEVSYNSVEMDQETVEEIQETPSSGEGTKNNESSPKTWKVLTVDGEIEEAVKVKTGRKRRSQIWKHFDKASNGKSAQCNYCTQVLSFAGSLSNLLRHLRKKHPSIASGVHLSNGVVFDTSLDSVIVEMDGSGRERLSSEHMRTIKSEQEMAQSCAKKLKSADIEFVLKRDHSYVEHPPLLQPDSLFAQFIQSEVNKFQSEYIKRKCKRDILHVLMKHQQDEDDLYSPERSEEGVSQ